MKDELGIGEEDLIKPKKKIQKRNTPLPDPVFSYPKAKFKRAGADYIRQMQMARNNFSIHNSQNPNNHHKYQKPNKNLEYPPSNYYEPNNHRNFYPQKQPYNHLSNYENISPGYTYDPSFQSYQNYQYYDYQYENNGYNNAHNENYQRYPAYDQSE